MIRKLYMGYAKIFWICEKPIRQYIAKNGIDDAMTLEVGRRVLSLGTSDNHHFLREPPMPLPFFETPNVFSPFTSVHAKDFSLLLWTGDRLCRISDVSPAMFDTLCELSTLVGSSHLRLPLSEDEYLGVAEARLPQSDVKNRMHASVYWMYEDFSRNYSGVPESEWPMKDVGTATLDLMMSSWPRSKGVLWHGNAISRCCSVARPECAVLVWWRNCLRAIADVEPDELSRMRDYLSDRGSAANCSA